MELLLPFVERSVTVLIDGFILKYGTATRFAAS